MLFSSLNECLQKTFCIYILGSLSLLGLVSIMISRLSLQYHPDKNKDKGAQQKFAEINNGNFIPLFSFSLMLAHGPLFIILLAFFCFKC